jgi:malate synthase
MMDTPSPLQLQGPRVDGDESILTPEAKAFVAELVRAFAARLRHNIRVGIQYLEAWLRGSGCVPLYHLMEDAATAEISRTQIWQWLAHGVETDDGRPVTAERIVATIDDEMAVIRSEVGDARFEGGTFAEARALFTELATDTSHFHEFLTLPAYQQLARR